MCFIILSMWNAAYPPFNVYIWNPSHLTFKLTLKKKQKQKYGSNSFEMHKGKKSGGCKCQRPLSSTSKHINIVENTRAKTHHIVICETNVWSLDDLFSSPLTYCLCVDDARTSLRWRHVIVQKRGHNIRVVPNRIPRQPTLRHMMMSSWWFHCGDVIVMITSS